MSSSSLPAVGPSLPRAVRACLGLTQQQMAEYLGVRRVRVAEAEAGTRPLPLAALPRLAALATCLAPTPEAALAAEAPAAEAPAEAEALRRRQRAATAEASRLRQQLAAAEARAAQARARLALLPTLAAAPPVAAPAVGPAWLRVLALEAETTLAEAGPTAQLLLRLRA